MTHPPRYDRVATIARVAGLPLLLLLCFSAAILAALATAHQAPQDSDTVQSFLAADSIRHGNLLLSGWRFAADNFFFTDTLPFAIFAGLFGRHNAALTIIPALTYALIVAVALTAALRSVCWSRDNLAALATIMLLLGLPPFDLSYSPLLVPDTHAASCLLALTALLLLATLAKAGRIRDRPFLVLAFAAMTLAAVASDPYTIVFAFIPALLVLGIEMLAGQDVWKAGRLLVVLCLPLVLGAITPLAIAYLGGFRTEPTVQTEFVRADHLSSTVAGFVFGFLYSSGADIFGKPALASATLANAARFAGWLLGGAAALWRFRCRRRIGPDGLLDRFLLASCAVVAPVCICSSMFDKAVQNDVFIGGAGTRYIAPVVAFGGVLAARAVPDLIGSLPTQRFRLVAAGILAFLAGGLLITHTRAAAIIATSPSWVDRSDFIKVAQWLWTRHLTCGAGDYWSASIVTALSHGIITVRALDAPPDNRLEPLRWLEDDHWYGGTRLPAFIMWQDAGSVLFNVNETSVTASYGPPARIERFNGFTIAILPAHPEAPGPAVRCFR